ncbi:MAG TPA: nitroreductase family deazaflavin-dependent oxidoreductase [Candidatus Dormibacteraeota bacterium]|jgi:deazaflavin-dependent oxidoreductase (nitroreductase family)|nr:nitroreductase family deazaflavin-dependent oxidoreductase [Candidatus Dormibacteraeota bacterium]
MPKVAATALGAMVGAALAYPPSRRQIVRVGRVALDALALRLQGEMAESLLILTCEGHRSGLPRTVILSGLELDGDLYVLSWSRHAAWLRNVERHPQVVVDDRVKVRRATAEPVPGEVAERVRQSFVESRVPAPLRSALGREGAPLGPGLPVVRLVPR